MRRKSIQEPLVQPDELTQKFYTVEQLAKEFGVSDRYIRYEIERGALVAFKPSTQILRIARTEVRKWIAAGSTVEVTA